MDDILFGHFRIALVLGIGLGGILLLTVGLWGLYVAQGGRRGLLDWIGW